MHAQVGRPQLSNHGVGGGAFLGVLRGMRNGVLAHPAITSNGSGLGAGAFDYMIDGVTYTKVAQPSIVLSALGLPVTGVGEVSKWRLEIDSAGAFLVTAVAKRTVSAVIGGIESVPAPPRTRFDPATGLPRGYCTVAIINQPASYTPGTTAASNLTIVNGDPDLMQPALIG
jgi:hypothetical protein